LGLKNLFSLHRFELYRHLVDGTVKSVWFRQVFGLVPFRGGGEFEDTKRVIKRCNQRKTDNTMEKGQKEKKQRSTKHHIEKYRSITTNPSTNRG
jgi:hypothetical protein